MTSDISPIPEIVDDLKQGKMVILVDEEDRENEGDLVMAAEHVTAEAVNFMATFGRGLICLTLTEDKCRQLRLTPMVGSNGSRMGTNFTASIEAAEGVTTGISAADRAKTIKVASSPDASFDDLVQPGHVFPLRAEEGGVLVRAGHTEAGCDLASMAGLQPTSVICEILKENGEMARLPDLINFSREHGLKIGTIADYVSEYNRNTFQGGLQWYRCSVEGVNQKAMSLFAGCRITVPSLFLSGKKDWGIYQTPGAIECMRDQVCTSMKDIVLIDNAGHWVQQEQSQAVIDTLSDFLGTI